MLSGVVLLFISFGSSAAGQSVDPEQLVNATGTSIGCQARGDSMSQARQIFKVTLASPTTWKLVVNDANLQQEMRLHPVKCVMHNSDTGTYSQAGRMLILGTGCALNNEDFVSCYRKINFPYPVPPSSPILKIQMEIDVTSIGEATWRKDSGQKYAQSRDTSVASDISLEICASVGNCKANEGFCIPAFFFVYEAGTSQVLRKAALPKHSQIPTPTDADEFRKAEIKSENNDIIAANTIARNVHNPRITPFYNAWDDQETFEGVSHELAHSWVQPHALPAYGPYPHCPEDSKGRALPCTGGESLTLHVRSIELLRSEYLGDNKVAFSIRYELAWGDRYAVHPCTVDLSNIHTSGKQFTVSSQSYWLPSLKALDAREGESVIEASASLGVNTFVGQPVTEAMPTGNPMEERTWPKQLVLDRKHEVVFYPTKVLDWTKYPMDKQTLQLQISEMSVPAPYLTLDATDAVFTHKDAQVGDQWQKDSASFKVVKVRGRDYLQIEVEVSRDTKGKMHSIIIPMISVAFLDAAFHMLTSYTDVAQLFLTSAIVAGVGVQLVNPEFLGIPGDLAKMPFIQCLTLMVLAGGLKQMILILGRLFWLKRVKRIEAAIEKKEEELRNWLKENRKNSVVPIGLNEDEEVRFKDIMMTQVTSEAWKDDTTLDELQAAKKKQSNRLALYDRVIQWSVPVWYVLAFSIVTVAYLA